MPLWLFLQLLGLFTAVASLGAEHGSRSGGLQHCGSQALELRLHQAVADGLGCCGMGSSWVGVEPVSSALVGRLFTISPKGSPIEGLSGKMICYSGLFHILTLGVRSVKCTGVDFDIP